MTNSVFMIVTGALLNSTNLASYLLLKKGRKLTQVDATLENIMTTETNETHYLLYIQ